MYKFLQDKVFLDQLDNLRVKEQFIKITVLSWKEQEIQEIQGRVINGSLNIDGNSSLRRTANLTVFAEEQINDLTQIDEILSINRKVRLELGIVNTVPNRTYSKADESGKLNYYEIDYRKKYGNIIWFPLGVFVMFDPNISHSTTGVTISVNLKDKMCLLNGDAGGVIPAAVEFSEKEQEVPDGSIDRSKATLKQIIIEVVNHWGEEALSNIIVNDVDERIKQVVRWTGSTPLYKVDDGQNIEYFIDYYEALKRAHDDPNMITIFDQGKEVGFLLTDFTYPGEEFVGDVGMTVTSVLDKIIEVIGNYEYFYDVYGRFRFQEIKNYLNTTFTSQQCWDYNHPELSNSAAAPEDYLGPDTTQEYAIDLAAGMSVYTFNGAKLINSFTNAPSYSNIKNDFVVWGKRTTSEGVELPIRYHLAIDEKPKKNIEVTIEGKTQYVYGIHRGIDFYIDEFNTTRARSWIVSYTSFLDFPEYGHEDRVYYDQSGFGYYEWNIKTKKYEYVSDPSKIKGETIYTQDWREELYYQGIESIQTATDCGYYFTELIEEWPKLYDLKHQQFKEQLITDPAAIDFYLDMIDVGTDVSKYSVPNIGRRSYAVEEDGINCVFEQEVPDIVFLEIGSDNYEDITQELRDMKQAYTQVDSNIYMLLLEGGWQNSAFQRVRELIYQYTNMNNSITINAIPIYYLEPNTRITVNDAASGIYGDYIIQTISIPLDISGMMSLTANKALQKI